MFSHRALPRWSSWMERGSARRKQAARWWTAEARVSAVAQGSERVATPRLTSESVRGPHSREVPTQKRSSIAEGLAPPLSLSLAVCTCSPSRCADDRHATSARSTGILVRASTNQSNWALLVRGLHPAEVLTRTEVLTAEERGPNTAIVSFLTHAALLTSNV